MKTLTIILLLLTITASSQTIGISWGYNPKGSTCGKIAASEKHIGFFAKSYTDRDTFVDNQLPEYERCLIVGCTYRLKDFSISSGIGRYEHGIPEYVDNGHNRWNCNKVRKFSFESGVIIPCWSNSIWEIGIDFGLNLQMGVYSMFNAAIKL